MNASLFIIVVLIFLIASPAIIVFVAVKLTERGSAKRDELIKQNVEQKSKPQHTNISTHNEQNHISEINKSHIPMKTSSDAHGGNVEKRDTSLVSLSFHIGVTQSVYWSLAYPIFASSIQTAESMTTALLNPFIWFLPFLIVPVIGAFVFALVMIPRVIARKISIVSQIRPNNFAGIEFLSITVFYWVLFGITVSASNALLDMKFTPRSELGHFGVAQTTHDYIWLIGMIVIHAIMAYTSTQSMIISQQSKAIK